jgi:hypothetical protein
MRLELDERRRALKILCLTNATNDRDGKPEMYLGQCRRVAEVICEDREGVVDH